MTRPWRQAHLLTLVTPWLALCVGAGLLIFDTAARAQGADPLEAFLRNVPGLSARDVRSVDVGRSFARTVETGMRREVAMFGVVWIEVPATFFLERYRDIERFEGGTASVPQLGRFSEPPALADMAGLSLSAHDLEDLRTCHVGECDVRLPASGLVRFRTEVEWGSPHEAEQANRVMGIVVLEALGRYRAGGLAQLGTYDDDPRPVRASEEFTAMIVGDRTLLARAPQIHRYLLDYPAGRLPGAEDFFYWSSISFGLKPTVRANHVTIFRMPEGGPIAYALASRQIYSSHYFNAALELRFVVPDPRRPPGHPGFFLVVVNRSRIDGLSGFVGLALRSTIVRRTRDAMTAYLDRSKRKLEADFATTRR